MLKRHSTDCIVWYNGIILSHVLVLIGLYSIVHCTKVKPGDTPTFPILLKFPAKPGKFIDIIQKVMGLDCEKLGIFLLDDDDGNTISSIRESKMHQCEPICTEIFNRWLHGVGRWPVTWETLVESLRTVDLNFVADIIERQYKDDAHVSHDKEGTPDKHKYENMRNKAHVRGKVQNRQRKISDFQLLYQATAEVGNWIALCSGLGGVQLESKIDELKYTSMDVSSKKRECLKAYYNLGEVYWEDVVNIVSSYPITKVRLALKIAKEHGVDFRPKQSRDEL